jgi:hypothetical protein
MCCSKANIYLKKLTDPECGLCVPSKKDLKLEKANTWTEKL